MICPVGWSGTPLLSLSRPHRKVTEVIELSLVPGASTRSYDSGLRRLFVHSRWRPRRNNDLDRADKYLFADRLAQESRRTRLRSLSLLIVSVLVAWAQDTGRAVYIGRNYPG